MRSKRSPRLETPTTCRVPDAIGDVLGYERWWADFVIRAGGDGGAAGARKPQRARGTADGTVATLDWRPSVNHRLIRYLTPALRPLFRSDHTWTMRRGERQIPEDLGAA